MNRPEYAVDAVKFEILYYTNESSSDFGHLYAKEISESHPFRLSPSKDAWTYMRIGRIFRTFDRNFQQKQGYVIVSLSDNSIEVTAYDNNGNFQWKRPAKNIRKQISYDYDFENNRITSVALFFKNFLS